jgi:hypothetical protein
MALRASDGFSAYRAEVNALRAEFDAIGAGLSLPSKLVYVEALADFPDPVIDVITLANDTTYFIVGTVDLAGNRLVCGLGNVIAGNAASNSILKSTGLAGAPLISAQQDLTLQNFEIADLAAGAPALALDATLNPAASLTLYGMHFDTVAEIGTVLNYGMIVADNCVFADSAELVIDGTTRVATFFRCMFQPQASSTFLTLAATAVISSRFKILYSGFTLDAASKTGIEVIAGASIPDENFVLDSVTFTGAGTPLVGITAAAAESMFIDCSGVPNSGVLGQIYWHANATATVIAAPSTPVKADATTTGGVMGKFDFTSGRLTYTGSKTRTFLVSATLSAESGNNHIIAVYIAKGGSTLPDSKILITTSGTGKAENAGAQTAVELAPNEYIEVFVANNTSATNITVTDLSLIVRAV